MKKTLLFCLSFVTFFAFSQPSKNEIRKPNIPSQTDVKAKSILDKTAAKYRQTMMKVDFTLVVNDTKTGEKENMNGDVVMKGNKFKLTVPTSQTFYNGETQFIYVQKNNEVTLTKPTKKELQEINPAYLLNSYTDGATIQFSRDNKTSDSFYTIDIFPNYRDKKNYYKAIVRIDRTTMLLKSIKILSQNGVHTTFTAKKEEVKSYNDAFFTFYPKAYPNVIVNDLR